MLKVYAHPASQPSRAVIWSCLIKGVFFEVHPDPTRITEVNPREQMPAINDDGFVLSEMPAILAYLASKEGWEDLYPRDFQVKARIDSFLHAHHCLTRLATLKLMAPHVQVAFGGPLPGNALSYISNLCIQESMSNEDRLVEGQGIVEQMIDYVEAQYLSDQDFVCGTAYASIADIACYEEIGQLEPANLVDFSSRTNITRWMERMRDLPHHDVVHSFGATLGDIRTQPNTMERFGSAVDAAMSALKTLDNVVIA